MPDAATGRDTVAVVELNNPIPIPPGISGEHHIDLRGVGEGRHLNTPPLPPGGGPPSSSATSRNRLWRTHVLRYSGDDARIGPDLRHDGGAWPSPLRPHVIRPNGPWPLGVVPMATRGRRRAMMNLQTPAVTLETPAAPVVVIEQRKGLAIVAIMVVGIVAAVLGLIPLFGLFALAGGIVALVLGLLAASKAKKAQQPVRDRPCRLDRRCGGHRPRRHRHGHRELGRPRPAEEPRSARSAGQPRSHRSRRIDSA